MYNSATVSVHPIIEISLGNWPEWLPPTQIEVTLTWGQGRPQPMVTFPVAAPSANGYVVAVQVADPVSESGVYSWKAHVRLVRGTNGIPADIDLAGQAAVVVRDHPRLDVGLP